MIRLVVAGAAAAFALGTAAPASAMACPDKRVCDFLVALLAPNPLREGGCSASVGDCDQQGHCTVNVGYCADGGSCTVNVGYCDDAELIGL